MRSDRRRLLVGLATFTLVFAGLSLPAPGLGRALVRVASERANRAIGGDALGHDLDLRFEPAAPRVQAAPGSADRAWMMTLRAERYPTRAHALIRFDLRRAFWVPFVVFIALVLASPIWRSARGPIVAIGGALALQIAFGLSLWINAAGILYENYVIDLSEGVQSALRFGHALLAPPGMAYAIPLLLWAALLHVTRPRPRRSESLAPLVSARSQ